jgi:hypothetical protein
MMRWTGTRLTWLLTLLLVAGCGRAVSSEDLFPERDAIPGWAPADKMQVFESGNLYDLVNGQADSFFVYGFEQVHVLTYESETGGQLRLEIWQMDTASNAYGLYSMLRSGEPVPVGNSGVTDPGRRVDFWQDRAFVRVFSFAPEDAATLEMFAAQVSSALPSGGQLPALIERLPKDGLVGDSEVFFHEETSIQDRLWLGGQNLLALSAETDAVLARYMIQDTSVWLLLVEYPEEASASAALQTLTASEFDTVSAAAVEGRFLGAVFGTLPKAEADQLLMIALEGGM